MKTITKEIREELDALNYGTSTYWLIANNLRTLDQKIAYVADQLKVSEESVREVARTEGYL